MARAARTPAGPQASDPSLGRADQGVPFPLPRNTQEGNGGHDSPWIVMRYTDDGSDVGNRPITVEDFYDSPDVWVTNSKGINVPEANKPNQVFARVNNWGLQDASGVIVRFYWANPSLAITETSAHRIDLVPGTVPPPPPVSVFVPAGNSLIVPCPLPWTPTIENDGHECLLAEAWVPFFDDRTAPLDAVNDRHTCQKNLNLVEVPAGMPFHFTVEVANISSLVQEVVVQLRMLSFREIKANLSKSDIGYRGRLEEAGYNLQVELELSEVRAFRPTPSTIYPRRLLAAAQSADGIQEIRRSAPMVTQATTFEPWETRQLILRGRVPPEARPGQVFALRLTEKLGEIVTGGYTLYVVVKGPDKQANRLGK